MSESAQTRPAILDDLRRMAPVWGIVVCTAVVIVLSMRYVGAWHLRNTAFTTRNSCEYADIYYASAKKQLLPIRELAAAIRLDEAAKDLASLESASLGILPDDPTLEAARGKLYRALQICPQHALSHRTLSLLEWYRGDEAAAYAHLGDYYRIENKVPEARINYQLALTADPDNGQAVTGHLMLLVGVGETGEALQIADAHPDALKGTTEGKFALGRLYARTGRLAEAESLLREGLVENPADRQAIRDAYTVFRGLARQREGADFLMSLGDDGRRTITESYHTAAILYNEIGDLPREEQALRKALVLFPNNADISFALAVCLYKQDKMAAARDMVRRASEIDMDAVMRGIERSGVDPRS